MRRNISEGEEEMKKKNQNETELLDISFHAGLGVVGKGFPKKETLDVYRDFTPIPGTV